MPARLIAIQLHTELMATSSDTLAKSAVTTATANPAAGWLRNPTFDFHFIATITFLAVIAGVAGRQRSDLFQLFLLLDVWFLGYHHVVSTFTRLCFDKQSFQENKFLVVYLPILVIVGTLASVYFIGSWTIATTYLYWQWFHYTRQSYGIERMYRRKAGEGVEINDYLTTRVLYLVPIFGILYRSWQRPTEFIGMELFTFFIPTWLVIASGVIAAAATVYWGALQVKAYGEGKFAKAHCSYVVSHLVIFMFGYVLIDDITAGWLVINIWHNAQYILFVWWFNNKRFEKGVDPKSQFLSTISQRENLVIYMGICLAISTVVYAVLGAATSAFTSSTISLTVFALMVLNFHHYIVDGIIWKRKRMKPKATQPSPSAAAAK